jgi:ribosomal protein L7/L12
MATVEQQEIYGLRQRISRLEAQVDQLYKHLGITFVEDIRAGDDPKVIAALRANNMIEAIKYYREKNNVGLAEAKLAVEEMRARLGI